MKLRELSSGREYQTHHDRLSNPLFSGKEVSREQEANANPEENPKEPEAGDEPAGNPEEALMRTTRSGRVVKPNRDKDFDYSAFLFSFNHSEVLTHSFHTSTISSEFQLLQSCFSCRSLPPAHLDSVSLTQVSMIRSRQCERLRVLGFSGSRVLGFKVCWVKDADGVLKQMVLLRSNGALLYLDVERDEWISPIDDCTTLAEVLEGNLWERPQGARMLEPSEVALPPHIKDFPSYSDGLTYRHNYGYSDEWLSFCVLRAREKNVVLPPVYPSAGGAQVSSPSAITFKVTASPVVSTVATSTVFRPVVQATQPIRPVYSQVEQFGTTSAPLLTTHTTFSGRAPQAPWPNRPPGGYYQAPLTIPLSLPIPVTLPIRFRGQHQWAPPLLSTSEQPLSQQHPTVLTAEPPFAAQAGRGASCSTGLFSGYAASPEFSSFAESST